LKRKYPYLEPEIEKWPIFRFGKGRDAYVKSLVESIESRFASHDADALAENISKTVYMESQRVKNQAWKVDPADDEVYWKNIGKELNAALIRSDKEDALRELLSKIIKRYAEEIVGSFDKNTFLFARRFLNFMFRTLLSPFKSSLGWFWGRRSSIHKKIKLAGHTETMRSLFDKGTVVVVPTHFSNIDSIMIGYGLDEMAGVPAFAYGAGLNLYQTEIAAYFMNRLGAYRVDRRKKNPIYLEALKTMASHSISLGVNNIFFPGGTRSRSGALEQKLKLGLLGAVVECQRNNLMAGKENKIYIVPMIMSYHFVLEAKSLVEEYLKMSGRERYVRQKDQSSGSSKFFNFLRQVFTKESEVVLSFGAPMDVLGNEVDTDGNSFDKNGNRIFVEDYFKDEEGVLSAHPQREGIYTKLLGEKIVEKYHQYNVVLSSHVVSFTCFHLFTLLHREPDVFSLLTLSEDEFVIDEGLFAEKLGLVLRHLRGLADSGNVLLDDVVAHGTTESVIQHAWHHGWHYHMGEMLVRKDQKVYCKNIRLLYFYHNRLSTFELDSKVQWNEGTKILARQKS